MRDSVALFTCCAAMVFSSSSDSQVNLRNGADLDMTGSTGSQVIFPDGSTLASANNTGVPPEHGNIFSTIRESGVPTNLRN